MAKGKKYLFEVLFGGKVNPSLGTSINKTSSQFSKLQGFAKKAAAGIGAAFAAVKIKDFVGDSINTYKDYEKSLAQTAATAGIAKGTKEFALLDKAAMDAGKATSKTAAEAADALGYMALAGWNVNQSTAALMPVLRLSESTQADLAETSNLVTGSMASMGIAMDSEGKNIDRYLDVVIAMNNKSKQTAAQAMEAFAGVGSTLKGWKTPIEESGAVLGVLANRQIAGSEAGNALSSIMINITKKSGESAKAMEELGLSAYDAEGKFKGIITVFRELNEKISAFGDNDNLKDKYLNMIGGKTQKTTLANILDGFNVITEDGSTEIEHLVKEFKNSDGALNNMAETIGGTMSYAFDLLTSATDSFKITFVRHFEGFITPVINGAAEKISLFTDKMDKGITNIKRVAGAFMKLIGIDTTSFGFNFGDAGAKLAISEITGLDTSQIETLANIFTVVKDNIILASDTVKSMFITSLDNAKKVIGGIGSFVLDTFANIDFISFFKGVGENISSYIGNSISVASTIFDTLKEAGAFLMPYISDMIPIIADIGSTILDIGLTILGISTNIAIGIGNAIKKMAPVVLNIFKAVLPVVAGIEKFILNAISVIAKGIKFILNSLVDLPNKTATLFSVMKSTVVNIAIGLYNGVKTTFINMKNSVITTVTELWNNVKTTFANIKDSVITKATELLDRIKSIFDNIKESIAGAFTGAVNTAIGGLNTLIDKVNSVHISVPSWIPGVGGKDIGLNIPQVPALASGGIVTKPTLAMIGEGDESEAIFPLSKLEEFLTNYSTGNNTTNNSGMVFQIEYKPQIILQGNADKTEIKQEVEKATANAQRDFTAQMNQWLKEQKRYGFV